MIIRFILPRSYNKMIGGYKVVFQYANFLVRRGNDVHIYFQLKPRSNSFIIKKLKFILGATFKRNTNRKITWFDLDNRIKLHFDFDPKKSSEELSTGKVVATHWTTAQIVLDSSVQKENKFHFIQGYEVYDSNATVDKIEKAWKLPLNKIVISKWLLKKANELGVKATYVPNFIDLETFKVQNLQRNTERGKTISFLWHSNPRKQSAMGLSICKKLKKIDSTIKVIVFGVNVPKNEIFDEIFESATPTQLANQIYGKSAVYMMPSSSEGWGLTGLEAMACGAVLISVDNGGVNEYMRNDISGVITENDEQQLLQACLSTLNDKGIRSKLSDEGYKVSEQFSLSKSGKMFEDILKEV